MHDAIVRTTNETDILEMLDFSERSEDPCEHSQHNSKAEYHEGPGEWLVKLNPCACGRHNKGILLFCNKFYQYIFSGKRIMCQCGSIYPENSYTVLGRKGVDF